VIKQDPDSTKKIVQYNKNALIVKTLSSYDPAVGNKSVRYSYIENKFKTVENGDATLEILNLDESIINKADALANTQDEYHGKKKKLKQKMKKDGEGINEKEIDSYKSMRNRLTFCERASTTEHKVILQREVETEKLERINHYGIFHEWDLFDTYMANFISLLEKKRKEEEIKMKGKATESKMIQQHGDVLQRPSLLKALKLLERQIMQIVNGDRYLFYREWNKHDDSQDSSKMLYMLLSFPQNARIRNRAVTALCWNTKFEDLFAVGYGSYEFPKKKEDKTELDDHNDEMMETGYIYVFSIKNNFFPEVKYTTDSGVLSLDFHPKDYALLVAGMYDGTVCVYDISKKQKTPILTCDIRYQKHMDPVWQVKWYTPFNEPNEFVFYSISSDGRIIRWSFFKNKALLETEEVIILKYADNLQKDSQPLMLNQDLSSSQNNTNVSLTESVQKEKQNEEVLAFGNSGGMCFDFNKHKNFEHYFVVGTEEGKIFLCSTKHREHPILKYEGHTMGVYCVAWNPFHPKVFASCSADWNIKIWHYKSFAPLMTYDMQSAIGDLAWSPWCSTIFATVNVSGDIKFFDINRARRTPLEPKRYKDIPINHIAFNKSEFVFITGNDKGKVNLWKMAEPLRVTIDKKELEEKEKEEKAKAANNTNLPTTKIVIPPNLQDNIVKTRKAGITKKAVKKLDYEAEKKRVDEFLELLDITDL
jgi:dynein intermediate chain 1